MKFLVHTAFTCNGSQVWRQIQRLPMGLPQLAILACYPVEKAYVLVCRFIDDFWTSGMTPPHQKHTVCSTKKLLQMIKRWCICVYRYIFAKVECIPRYTTARMSIPFISSDIQIGILLPHTSSLGVLLWGVSLHAYKPVAICKTSKRA